MRRIAREIARTLALYAFAAWVYVALVALILPNTLPLQLTHLSRYPRTDTFGEISFAVSLVSYLVQRLLADAAPAAADGHHHAVVGSPDRRSASTND